MKKIDLSKVKDMAGRLLPKKSGESTPEAGGAAKAKRNRDAESRKLSQLFRAKPRSAEKGAAAPAKRKLPLPSADTLKNPAFIVPAAAFVLLVLSWCFTKNPLVCGILGVLSALCTLYVLLPDIRAAFRRKDLKSGLLLLVLAAILYAVAGRIPGAAAALLLWAAGQRALAYLKARKQKQLAARRGQSPLSAELPDFVETPVLTLERERVLQNFFTFLSIFLAAVVAVIAALSRVGYPGALRRAAVILVLGSTGSFFAGFPFSDLSQCIAAGDLGVLFRGGTLSRLPGVKLCCVSEAEPELFDDVAVYPTMPNKVNGETLVKMAALTMSRSEGLWAEKLAAICETPPEAEGLEIQPLEGFGVAAKINNLTVICGSAEFMRKAELPVIPFRDGDNVLHIAVNSFYAGCMELDIRDDLPEDVLDAALTETGFFRFSDEEDAAIKRQSGETVLFASPNGKPVCEENDIFVSSGISQPEADIVLSHCGVKGLLDMCAVLRRTVQFRSLLTSLALSVKAILFLLAVFGICPLWLAVLLELALIAADVFLGSKAPKMKE